LKIEPGRSLGRLQSGLDLRVEVPFDRSLLREDPVDTKTCNNGERCSDFSYA
jgi:hypothetical protein